MTAHCTEKPTTNENRRTYLWLAVLIAAAAAFRLYALGGRVMFMDDALTHWFALMPAGDTIRAAAGERTPPLAVLLAHFWLLAAPHHSEFWLRLPFALINIAAMPFLFAVGCAAAGKRPALAACFLYAVSPMMIAVAQVPRYPSIEIFFMMTALFYYIKYIQTGRAVLLAGFTLSLAAGFYTHYFFIIVAGAFVLHALFFLRGKQRLLSLGGVVVSFALFIPWLTVFAHRAAREVGYVGREGIVSYLKTIPLFAIPHVLEQYLTGGYAPENFNRILFAILVCCVVFLFIVFLIRAFRNPAETLLLFVLALPLAAAWILKIVINFPLVTFPQFSCGIAPVFFLCLAIGWSRLGRFWTVASAVPLLFILAMALNFHFATLGAANNSRDALLIVNSQKQAGDILLMLPPECAPLVNFYDPSDIPSRGVTADLDPLQYNATARAERPPLDDEYLATLNNSLARYRRAWVFWCGGTAAEPDPQQKLLNFMNSHYETILSKHFVFNAGQASPGSGLLNLYDIRGRIK